jgi:hypothetical protein
VRGNAAVPQLQVATMLVECDDHPVYMTTPLGTAGSILVHTGFNTVFTYVSWAPTGAVCSNVKIIILHGEV